MTGADALPTFTLERGRHMPHLDRETFDRWQMAVALVTGHETTLRAALEHRRDFFTDASEQARTRHEAGCGNEPVERTPGHMNVAVTNAGWQNMAALYRQQAEAAVRALQDLNASTGDDYEID